MRPPPPGRGERKGRAQRQLLGWGKGGDAFRFFSHFCVHFIFDFPQNACAFIVHIFCAFFVVFPRNVHFPHFFALFFPRPGCHIPPPAGAKRPQRRARTPGLGGGWGLGGSWTCPANHPPPPQPCPPMKRRRSSTFGPRRKQRRLCRPGPPSRGRREGGGVHLRLPFKRSEQQGRDRSPGERVSQALGCIRKSRRSRRTAAGQAVQEDHRRPMPYGMGWDRPPPNCASFFIYYVGHGRQRCVCVQGGAKVPQQTVGSSPPQPVGWTGRA